MEDSKNEIQSQGDLLIIYVQQYAARNEISEVAVWQKLYTAVGGGNDPEQIRAGSIRVAKWKDNALAMTQNDVAITQRELSLSRAAAISLYSAGRRLELELSDQASWEQPRSGVER